MHSVEQCQPAVQREAGQVVEFSNWVAKGDPNSVPEDLKIVLAGLRDMRKKKRK